MSIRDLRNRGGEVVDRVLAGERLVVTRDGRPVAELRPLPPLVVDAETLLARWRRLPYVDLDAFRADVDDVVDSSL